ARPPRTARPPAQTPARHPAVPGTRLPGHAPRLDHRRHCLTRQRPAPTAPAAGAGRIAVPGNVAVSAQSWPGRLSITCRIAGPAPLGVGPSLCGGPPLNSQQRRGLPLVATYNFPYTMVQWEHETAV